MLNVRQARTEDAEDCAAIYAPYVEETWISFEKAAPTPDEMAARIAKSLADYDWLVAELDGVIAGYAYGAQHRARTAYQTSCDVAVYIDQKFSRRGLGRTLYDQLLPALKAKKMHAAFAGIALPNEASIKLHQSLGFTQVGIYREVGWKMDAWRDVLWLQRLL